MKSLSRVFRAVLWGAVTSGLLSLVRQWSLSHAGQTVPGRQNHSPAIRLHRDPDCGTHVSPEISVKLEKSGRITHFCSARCRERYAGPAARVAGV